MAAVSQTIFSDAFSGMKIFVFWFKKKFLPRGLIDIGLDNGLAPNRGQTIIWTNVDRIH